MLTAIAKTMTNEEAESTNKERRDNGEDDGDDAVDDI